MEEEREYCNSMGFPFSAVAGEMNSSDVDFSFNSTASTSSSSFATTSNYSSCSARSSLSLPSFSSSTSLINPLPHSRSNSAAHWSAIRAAASLSRDGALHLSHLSLIRHVGSGHLARVFHCRLKGSRSYDFALKVVDLDQSARALSHVRTEARVLAAVDHPFLPTLYARMDASHYACFLIDYCPGGDLHSLLVRHPGHRLPLPAVRFYAAEVLLALEYLHALGFVYRDLKPENVLIRSDGHIMLSDFDLCFSSDPNPSVRRRRLPNHHRRQRRSGCCWSSIGGGDDGEEELEVVAEPEGAYSRECVGTHEYLAPEIVSGSGHGKGVDWWAFGVFVYELMYGRTPFKGRSKEETLKNVMAADLRFPDQGDEAAADLVRRLLVRDAAGRMGCSRGAAEIKKHPFFDGVRWQLMRGQRPPVVVGPDGAVVVKVGRKGSSGGWRYWLSRIAGKLCHRSSSKKGIKVYNSSASGGIGSNGMKSKKRLTRQKAMKL